ncbi:MAG: gliding motility-associated ABC transporter permease subunit GldF [Cytophagaceae bacterium]
MYSIFRKEINSFFNSLIAYLVIAVFLSFIGLFLWVLPDSSILEYGFADMESLFSFGPLAFLLLIPAITMRTFAEERKEGTIELLLTRPLTDWQIILGKYFSSLALVLFALIPTLIYYISIYNLGNPSGNIDSAAVFSSYLGLFLLGAVYTSIGIFCSSITKSQIVAFILAVILCYTLFDGMSRIASIDLWGDQANFITVLGLDYHYHALSKGLIDSRNVLYFLSVIFIMLSSTKVMLGSRKW